MKEYLSKLSFSAFSILAATAILPSPVVAADAPPAGLPAAAAPATAAVPQDGPRIAFSEIIFDFGKQGTSQPLRHDFIVTNIGNALLEITQVQPGCGCTTAGEWDKKIEPGKTGKIPIQFNPANFSGPVTKYVTVTCNDPTHTSTTLQIKASVWRPIDAQPQYVYFMPTEGEETNETKVVKITSNLEEPVKLEKVESGNPAFKTELKTIQEGKQFELAVSYNYTSSASNPVPNTPITIKTSSTNMPTLTLTAYAMPQPAVVVYPMQIQLPPGPVPPGYKSSVTIRVNGRTETKLTDVAINSKDIKLDSVETQPGKMFMVNMAFPEKFQMTPGHPLELTVKTSHPKKPTITIPITQPAPPPVPVPQLVPTAQAGGK
jgi:hypothetical protein